jgi:hypothetical protein
MELTDSLYGNLSIGIDLFFKFREDWYHVTDINTINLQAKVVLKQAVPRPFEVAGLQREEGLWWAVAH